MTTIHSDRGSHPEALIACLAVTGIVKLGATGTLDKKLERALAHYCAAAGGRLILGDGALTANQFHLLAKAEAWVLPNLHNYYTAYHQIHGLHALCRDSGKSLLLILPSLEGPVRRRDYYRWNECIPAEWRQEIDDIRMDAGPQFTSPMLAAAEEGGLRNGVATAVEDACEEILEVGTSLVVGTVPSLGGLNVIFDNDADWAPALSAQLLRYRGQRIIPSQRHGSQKP